MTKITKITFRNVGRLWLAVDSAENKPPTLAEVLSLLNIIIDDNTEYARIKRYYEGYNQTIIYRKISEGCITIQINIYKTDFRLKQKMAK